MSQARLIATSDAIVAERGVPCGALRALRHLAPPGQGSGSGFWRTGRSHVRAGRSLLPPLWRPFRPAHMSSHPRCTDPGPSSRRPSSTVFVDPRIELFPDHVWNDYFEVSEGREGWDKVLARWDVDVVILHPAWAGGLMTVISHDPASRLLARTREGAAYMRVRPLAP
jgi:hypothetical protein